mgnify:FL=1
MNNLVVFASGGGSNFKSIYNNIQKNKIKDTRISLLISNNPKSKAVSFAKKNSINTFIANHSRYPDAEKYTSKLKNTIIKHNPVLIILAGYMKLIPKEIVEAFSNMIINIHPGKLPDFGGKGCYGMNVHRAVIDSKSKTTAVTIHYVNEEYDQGMIIHEELIDVLEYDTPESLAERVLKYEHKIYSQVINNIINRVKYE